MKQKDAVFQAITSVVTGGWEAGTVVAEHMTKELRAQVIGILFAGFRAKKIDLSREYDDDGLHEYCSGLLSNWLRKDNRLNGGVDYVAKNPGSRTGLADPQVKAMKALLTRVEDEDDRAMIQARIDARVAEIKPKAAAIDVNALPDELKHMVK